MILMEGEDLLYDDYDSFNDFSYTVVCALPLPLMGHNGGTAVADPSAQARIVQ